MKVIEALKKGKPTLSFEFFPPKTGEQEEKLFEVIGQLKGFRPDFVSVTYGALGTDRKKTFFWVKEIKRRFSIEPVAHLTCVAAGRQDMAAQLQELAGMGVSNILALRGDPPQGKDKFAAPADGFHHADELVSFIKHSHPGICVGVAGYPEKHPEAQDMQGDILNLKGKVAAGADYIISQLFFNNDDFLSFQEHCKEAGIRVPIVPGIMPVTSLKQVKKMTQICGASIPAGLLRRLEEAGGDKEAVARIGVEQAVAQCRGLLKAGVPGLHFFVMNQAGPISRILAQLQLDH